MPTLTGIPSLLQVSIELLCLAITVVQSLLTTLAVSSTKMQSSENSGGNQRLSSTCSAPSFRTYGGHATNVYGRGRRHCYAIVWRLVPIWIGDHLVWSCFSFPSGIVN